MRDYIAHNAKMVMTWGPLILALVIVLMLLVIYRVGRGNRYLLPRGARAVVCDLVAVVVLLVASLALSGLLAERRDSGATLDRIDGLVGSHAPPLSFVLLEEEAPRHLDDYRGRIVLINLWATWCTPCLRELPELARLHQTHVDRGVHVLALSDESRETLQAFFADNPPGLPVGYVPRFPWLDHELGTARPLSILVDRDGRIRAYFTGPYDYAFWESRIQDLASP